MDLKSILFLQGPFSRSGSSIFANPCLLRPGFAQMTHKLLVVRAQDWRLGERRLEVAPPLGQAVIPPRRLLIQAQPFVQAHLFEETGRIPPEEVRSLAGPVVRGPARRPRISSQVSAIIPATITLGCIAPSRPTRPRPFGAVPSAVIRPGDCRADSALF